jgi:ribosomal 30S subunit maturation factor RimM
MHSRKRTSGMVLLLLRRRHRRTTFAVGMIFVTQQLLLFNLFVLVDRIHSFPLYRVTNFETTIEISRPPLSLKTRRIRLVPSAVQGSSFLLFLASVKDGDERQLGTNGKKPVNDDDDTTQTQQRQRKKKKNKYNQFSKISNDDDIIGDPLDVMIAESKQKVQALQQEIQDNSSKSKWKRIKEEIANSIILQQGNNSYDSNNGVVNSNNYCNKLNFPDTKVIDPYDPTTFGYIKIGHVTGAHGVRGWIKVESSSSSSSSSAAAATTTSLSSPEQRRRLQQLLTAAGIRHLKPVNKRAPRQVLLLQGKHRLHDEYLLQLQDVDDRNAAMSLRGSVLYAREEDTTIHSSSNQVASLASNSNGNNTSATSNDNDATTNADIEAEQEQEYDVADLVGLDVYLSDNPTCFIGKVRGVVLGEEMCTIPGVKLHDMLEITLQKGPVPSFIRDELVLIPFVPDIVPSVNVPQECIHIQPPAGLLNLTYAMRPEKVRIKAFLPPGRERNSAGD